MGVGMKETSDVLKRNRLQRVGQVEQIARYGGGSKCTLMGEDVG